MYSLIKYKRAGFHVCVSKNICIKIDQNILQSNTGRYQVDHIFCHGKLVQPLMSIPWNNYVSNNIHVLQNIKKQLEENKLCVPLNDMEPPFPVNISISQTSKLNICYGIKLFFFLN